MPHPGDLFGIDHGYTGHGYEVPGFVGLEPGFVHNIAPGGIPIFIPIKVLPFHLKLPRVHPYNQHHPVFLPQRQVRLAPLAGGYILRFLGGLLQYRRYR